MAELVDLIRDWQAILVVLLLFGFAPGCVLRLIVHLYPKNHDRRLELIAELYAMKFIERPLFVAQQIETSLFEGLPARLRNRKRGDHSRVRELAGPIKRELPQWHPTLAPLADALNNLVEAHRDKSPRGLRSILITGAPGSAKGTIAPQLASALGWPLIEITPATLAAADSEVLRTDPRALFPELPRGGRAVILFNEMETLVDGRYHYDNATREAYSRSALSLMVRLREVHDGIIAMVSNTCGDIDFEPSAVWSVGFDLAFSTNVPAPDLGWGR